MDAFFSQFDPRELPETYPPSAEVKDRIQSALHRAIEAASPGLPGGVDRNALFDDLLNEAVGLGPLEYLLDDESVTEIQVNGPARIIVERAGQRAVSERTFTNAEFLYLTALRLLSVQGHGANPPLISEVRFDDGTLVQVILPPVAIGGAVISIRKPRRHLASLSELVERGTLTNNMAEFLHQCIEARRTLLIAGPSGSGRTTLTNALMSLVPDGARIVAVETTSMLQLPHHTTISLECQAASPHVDAVDAETLLRHATRLRPERLVVDEINGPEAFGFLLATAGGAAGSVGVLSALGAQEAITRLEQLAALGAPNHAHTLALQIASGVDVVIVTHRFADGSRRIVEVAEVAGASNGQVQVEAIFRFEPQGMGSDGGAAGRFTAAGHVPRFYRALERGGVKLNTQIFSE